MASEQPLSEEAQVASFKNDTKLRNNLRSAVNEYQKAVDELPLLGFGYEYNTSFAGFLQIINVHQKKSSTLLASLYNHAGCKVKLPKIVEDISKIVDANRFLDEKTASAIEQARSELGHRVMVPVLERTAESHGGMPTFVPEKALFGKDSGGKYAQLGSNPLKKADNSIVYHKGLYIAKNLPKPQTAFQNHIINDDAPFKSKLRVKHHAKERPQGNIKMIDEEAMETTSQWESDKLESAHPYDYELESFEIPDGQKVVGSLTDKKKLEEIPLSYVNDVSSLTELVDRLNKLKVFAVDVEHHNYRTFLGLTCLVQISTLDHDYIIDPFPIWNEMWRLNEPFTNPNILKIFHGAEFDVEWLQRDFGIYVVNMFDTHIAMRALGMSRLSLQYLVEHFCGVTLGKELQKADWRIRPLTMEHLNYARGDTHYLLYCYEHLRNELLSKPAEQNLLKNVYIQSTGLCRKIYEQPRYVETGYLKLISKRHPNNQQIYALKELWKWRDFTARELDESPEYILPNHMLMQIAEVLPREANGIISCCSPIPVYLKRDLMFIHKIMIQARDIPLDRTTIHGAGSGNALLDAFTRALDDSSEKTPFEKRLDEMFSCDCNEAILPSNFFDGTTFTSSNSEDNVASIPNDKVFTIGENIDVKAQKEIVQKLRKIHGILDDSFITPFETYQVALTTKKEEPSSEAQEPKEKTTFSHHDEYIPRPPSQFHKNVENDAESSIGGIEDEIPLLTLTKKAQKRRQQQTNRAADVIINRNYTTKRAKFGNNKGKKK